MLVKCAELILLGIGLAVTLSDCSRRPPVDLSTSLLGIEKSKFLSCSGPPVLEYSQAGQDRMSFVTNLKRGSMIGIAGPTATAAEACSVGTVFQNDRLVSSNFSGNYSMCTLVFGPCQQR
jgi:hypothetical protein